MMNTLATIIGLTIIGAIMVVSSIPRAERYRAIILTENIAASFDQMGLRCTASEFRDFLHNLRESATPEYYRIYCANLMKLERAVLGTAERTPKDLWLGMDIHVFREINLTVMETLMRKAA